MNKNYAVKFKNVSKIYKMEKTNKNTKVGTSFYAIKNVSFEIPKGESVGILGTNGSGKSTISKILAGISTPEDGEVDIIGEPALIAINSGLNGTLTGLENIELKGVLLGFSKERIMEITESVIEFSELGDFIHQPVKRYSSGMKSRLGFSISINMDPDIIIVDEALSVGDRTFNEKCLAKINEMKEKGKTIFFVSHSVKELKKFCDKGLWIEGGVLRNYDSIDLVAQQYYDFIKNYKQKNQEEKKKYRIAVYKNRLIQNDDTTNEEKIPKLTRKEKIRKRKYKKKIIISAIIAIGLFCAIYFGGTGLYKKFVNEWKTVKKESIVSLNKSKNYVFVTTGKVNSEELKYRDYIDKDTKVIEDIVQVTFNKDGKSISVSKIPEQLQYYYNSEGVSDELRYYYKLENNNENLVDYLGKVTNKYIDGIYEFDNKQLNEAMAIIGAEINTSQYRSTWKIGENETVINNLDYGKFNEQDYINIVSQICNNLRSIDEKNLKNYIKLISANGEDVIDGKLEATKNDKSELANIMNLFAANDEVEEIKLGYESIDIDETIVSKQLSSGTIIANTDVLNNRLIYVDGLVDLRTNIFVKRYSELSLETMNGIEKDNSEESNESTENFSYPGSNNSGSIYYPGNSNQIENTTGNGSNTGNNSGNTNNPPTGDGGNNSTGSDSESEGNLGENPDDGDGNASDSGNQPSEGEDNGVVPDTAPGVE